LQRTFSFNIFKMQLTTLIAALAGVSTVLATPILKMTGCDVSKMKVDPALYNDPKNASNHLAAPLPTEKLAYIFLGVGTQNYTCSSTGNATAAGAWATLYDASCLAYDDKAAAALTQGAVMVDGDMLSMMTQAASNMAKAQFFAGIHYFKGDFATPAFELNSNRGRFYGKVDNKVSAPVGSSAGKPGEAFGAVPSLKLLPKAGMGSTFTTVYRLHTAGGQSPNTNGVPTTCTWTGVKTFHYAALYYFYKSRV
jgi:hypothetical protein